MAKPTPLSEALDGLTTELAAQRRQRERLDRTAESEAGIEAKRHPLRHIGARGQLALLVRVPGWERMFTFIENPPLQDGVLACPCGGRPKLLDQALVKCSCRRYFVLSRDAVFVTYGESDEA